MDCNKGIHSYTEEFKFCLHWRKRSLHYRCSHTVFEKKGNSRVLPSLLGHCVLLLRLKDILRALCESKLKRNTWQFQFCRTTIVADDTKTNSITTKKLFHKAYSTLKPLNHFASSHEFPQKGNVLMNEIFRCKCWPATKQSTGYSLSALIQSKHNCSYLPCLGISSSCWKFYKELFKKRCAGDAREHRSWKCSLTRGIILSIPLHCQNWFFLQLPKKLRAWIQV